jgi:hypothetical protein
MYYQLAVSGQLNVGFDTVSAQRGGSSKSRERVFRGMK